MGVHRQSVDHEARFRLPRHSLNHAFIRGSLFEYLTGCNEAEALEVQRLLPGNELSKTGLRQRARSVIGRVMNLKSTAIISNGRRKLY